MARMRYEEPSATYAERERVYTGMGIRDELSSAVRSAWASPGGRALANALRSAAPRAAMHQSMIGLGPEIHRRLASVGPQLSRAYREIWGTSY